MYFFLTCTCIGIIKSSGVWKFYPDSKFPDKISSGLTDCTNIFLFQITTVTITNSITITSTEHLF